MTLIRFRIALPLMLGLTVIFTSCSTTQIVDDKTPLPVVPEYVKVPHPAGFDLADLHAILVSPLAPKAAMGEFADTCDEEFRKLMDATSQKEELQKGATEMVTQDPERMHWCFYAKISRLQEVLQSDSTWTARQKKVLENFAFLSPVANAFLKTYHDSRYLRWAAQYYSHVSEWVFFKKLAPTPESSVLFVNQGRPELEPWISVQRTESEPKSVFAKYGISFEPTVAGAVNPFETPTRTPASVKSTDISTKDAPPTEAPKSSVDSTPTKTTP